MLQGVLTLVAAITAAEALRETTVSADPKIQLRRRWIVVIIMLVLLIISFYIADRKHFIKTY